MIYRVIVQPTAAREIRSAVSWMIENASLAVAARWYNGLLKKIDTLRRHPGRCRVGGGDRQFSRRNSRTALRPVRQAKTPAPDHLHNPRRRRSYPLRASHRSRQTGTLTRPSLACCERPLAASSDRLDASGFYGFPPAACTCLVEARYANRSRISCCESISNCPSGIIEAVDDLIASMSSRGTTIRSLAV
jgi:plasmid stabilization system protein ParE